MSESDKPPHPDDLPEGSPGSEMNEFATAAALARALVDQSPSLIFSMDSTSGMAAWLSEGFLGLDEIGAARHVIDETEYPDGIPSTSLRFSTFGSLPGGNDAADVLRMIPKIREFLDQVEDIAVDAADQIERELRGDSSD